MHGISKVRAKLSSLRICSLGQVKFSLDKYIMVIYLNNILLFPHLYFQSISLDPDQNRQFFRP